MGWNITEVRLVTNPDVQGSSVIPPDRPNPANSIGAYGVAYDRLKGVFGIDWDSVVTTMRNYTPPSSDFDAAVNEACVTCSEYMTKVVNKKEAESVVVIQDTSAYRVVNGNEHDVYAWFYPRKSGTPIDWGITIQNAGHTYNVYVLIVFRMVQA